MAILKARKSQIVELQVVPGAHDVVIDYSLPAAIEMTPGLEFNTIQGTTRLNIDKAQRLLDRLLLPLPITFSVLDEVLEIINENERAQVVQQLKQAIEIAILTVLVIDSPRDLLKPWQQTRGEHFCTWPVRFGGRRTNYFSHCAERVINDVVEYTFDSQSFGLGANQAFNFTLDFFANEWKDSCVGQTVLVTLRNKDREVKQAKQIIGSGWNNLQPDRMRSGQR